MFTIVVLLSAGAEAQEGETMKAGDTKPNQRVRLACGCAAIRTAAGNSDYTPIIIPGAVHNLTIQWEAGQPFFWWYAAPGYTELLTGWVHMRF